jgi:hypothetical protein
LIPDPSKEGVMVKDWIPNPYEGIPRLQFLASMGAAGAGLVGFVRARGGSPPGKNYFFIFEIDTDYFL